MNFQIERNTNQIKHNQRQNFTGLVNIFMTLVKYCSYFFSSSEEMIQVFHQHKEVILLQQMIVAILVVNVAILAKGK